MGNKEINPEHDGNPAESPYGIKAFIKEFFAPPARDRAGPAGLSEEERLKLASDPSMEVRYHLAEFEAELGLNSLPSVLRKLAESSGPGSSEVRQLVATNHNAPADLLIQLSHDPEESVRNVSALNTSLPAARTFEMAINDPSDSVRQRAAVSLNFRLAHGDPGTMREMATRLPAGEISENLKYAAEMTKTRVAQEAFRLGMANGSAFKGALEGLLPVVSVLSSGILYFNANQNGPTYELPQLK